MSWTERGACVGRTDIDFVPTYPGAVTAAWRANTAAAKALCASCPVRADCLADALAHWGTAGIWGGTTELEREKMERARLHPPVALCGTNAGYYRHQRMADEPCAECRAAHAAYARKRTAAKRRAAA